VCLPHKITEREKMGQKDQVQNINF